MSEKYVVVDDEVREMVDGKITGFWKRDCSNGVRVQLLQQDTNGEIIKFFSEKVEAGEDKKEEEPKTEAKKNVRKRGKNKRTRK